MTTKQLLVENFYKHALTSDITDATGDITFTLSTVPKNNPGFLIISPDNAAKRETVFYHDVVWSTIYVKWINRVNPTTHAIGEYVQINDLAELFNFYAQVVSTTFYVEKTGNLAVKVWGWPALINGVSLDIPDTSLSMDDNTTNKIYFDYDDNTVKTTTGSISWNLLLANVVTATWVIASVTPNIVRPLTWLNGDAGTITVWTVTTLDPDESATVVNSWTINDAIFDFWIPKWVKGDTGDIWVPWPAWQTLSDNVVAPTWATVTTDDTTYIRVTETSWFYTEYNLTGIRTYDSSNNLLTEKLDTWVFWTSSIIYESWTEVNKTTGTISFNWQPAYRDQPNTFTQSQVFDSDVTLKWKVAFPFNNIGSQSWNFSFDVNNWMAQKVTLTWLSSHTVTLTNLTQWILTFFVVQNWSWAITFTASWFWISIIWWADWTPSFVNGTVASESGVHIFTILVAETDAHISYTWLSV